MFPVAVKILGVGRYLPKRVVQSTELDARYGTPKGWVERAFGVHERRWVEDETASYMGAQAGLEALSEAGIKPSDIDLIVNASGTPEQAIPDTGPLIQKQLGMGGSGLPAVTIHATCLSFIVAMDFCAALLATSRYNRILIVSSEIASKGLNFNLPESSSLFGDMAAAAVISLAAEGENCCIHASRLETYGEGAYLTQIAGGGTRKHPNDKETKPEDNQFFMDGPKILTMAVQYAPAFLERVQPGLSKGLGDIKLVIPHQTSRRGLAALKTLGWPKDRVVRNLATVGNCIAASLPGALYEAIREKRMARGDKVLLFGTGAGLSYGAMILTY